MSARYEIPVLFEDMAAPILGFDEGQLVDGSLLYLEPARDGLTSAPKLGHTFRNYACGSLSDLSGAALDDCHGVMDIVGAGVNGRMELTSKGALHGYFNKAVGGTAGTEDWRLLFPQALIDHLVANPMHASYTDAVFLVTADPLAIGSPPFQDWFIGITTTIDTGSGANVHFGVRNMADTDLSDGNNTVLWPAASFSTTLFADRNIWKPAPARSHARSGRTDVAPGLTAGSTGHVRWRGPKQSGSNVAGGQSFIFHSAYSEDCAISGRTPTEAMAWRVAQVAADFAPGGRYYGETWTDPATVAW